jgi:transposase
VTARRGLVLALTGAVTRPSMRFVAVKLREQQAALSMHRARDLLVRQGTQLVNMMRGLLARVPCTRIPQLRAVELSQ